jgi:hypothetical protein
MALELYVDKLPEDIRETFKAEIGKYVPVENREMAAALLKNNPHFSAEFQAALSRKHEESIQKFQQEKLPELIESEIKKRTAKDPATLEIEKLRAEIEAERKSGLLKERKSQAIAELSKLGLDPELADFVVDADEDQFKAKIEKLTGKVTSWRDEAMKKKLSEVLGQKGPETDRNVDPNKIMTRSAFEKLDPAARVTAIKNGAVIQEG